ncbi:MAG: endonuclease III [Nitrospinae bacterium]|nr:endonuclease III [Nitrospinota bacterium]
MVEGKTMTPKVRAKKIDAILKKRYPGASCSLDHRTPFELLVATILSAQCTDARVNMVTPGLFQRWPDAKALAGARLADVEEAVRSTGFYKNKAKALVSMSADLVARHGGQVPDTMEELTALAGVGRKTANVILGNVFGKPDGIVVDTHVGRLARRWGLTVNDDPVKVEADLGPLLPRAEWTGFSHRAILFGRELCQAKRPVCGRCPLCESLCPWSDKQSYL